MHSSRMRTIHCSDNLAATTLRTVMITFLLIKFYAMNPPQCQLFAIFTLINAVWDLSWRKQSDWLADHVTLDISQSYVNKWLVRGCQFSRIFSRRDIIQIRLKPIRPLKMVQYVLICLIKGIFSLADKVHWPCQWQSVDKSQGGLWQVIFINSSQ